MVGEGGIKCWFRGAYAAQRPKTARVSVCFPNLENFEAILIYSPSAMPVLV